MIMHKVLLWLKFEYYGPICCLFRALAISTRLLPHTHPFKRNLNNIRCSVATTYGNKLIAEIRAKTLGGSFIGQRSSQHNIKKGDEATFTHVNAYRVTRPWHQREAEAPCKNATQILA